MVTPKRYPFAPKTRVFWGLKTGFWEGSFQLRGHRLWVSRGVFSFRFFSRPSHGLYKAHIQQIIQNRKYVSMTYDWIKEPPPQDWSQITAFSLIKIKSYCTCTWNVGSLSSSAWKNKAKLPFCRVRSVEDFKWIYDWQWLWKKSSYGLIYSISSLNVLSP